MPDPKVILHDADTVGLSPKALLAAVLPTVGGVVAVLVQWVATGEFDRPELATAISAVVASLLAFLGAFAGSTGTVTNQPPAAGIGSDAALTVPPSQFPPAA